MNAETARTLTLNPLINQIWKQIKTAIKNQQYSVDIGIDRTLYFYSDYEFPKSYFTSLGYNVVCEEFDEFFSVSWM